MASALAWIALGTLLGLGIFIISNSPMVSDSRDESPDLIDGDIRPADLLRSPFHSQGLDHERR